MSSANPISIHDVSRETFSRLENYVALLLKWNRTINLIGKTTANDVWERHIADSLQLAELIPPAARHVMDMGSGAGLPGIVLACYAPQLTLTLVERDQRKASFLVQATQALSLTNVQVVAAPIETVTGSFDVITARALAALPKLCQLAMPRLGKNATCLFPKGAEFATELAEARRYWQFEHRLHPSKTNEKSCIISLTELSPRESTMGNA